MIVNKNTILASVLISNFLNAGLEEKVSVPAELKKELTELDIKTLYNAEQNSPMPNIKQTHKNGFFYLAYVDYFNEEQYYLCQSNKDVEELAQLVTNPNGPAHKISWYTLDANKYSFVKDDDGLRLVRIDDRIFSLKEASKKNATF